MDNKLKYKPGDRVRVRSDLKVGRQYYMADKSTSDRWVGRMESFAGKVVTIDYILTCGKYRVKECPSYNWTDGMFEDLIEERAKPIVIYQRDDQHVIALDKNTGLKAEAKCSPEDTFNFYTGAQLAFERLMKTPVYKVAAFKVGDYVIGTKKADAIYTITGKGWVGKVTEVDLEHDLITVRGYNESYWGPEGITDYDVDPSCFRPLTADDVPAGVLALLKDKS